MDQRLLRRRRAKRKRHKTGLNKLLQEFRPNFKLPASYRRFAYDQLQFVILPLLAFFNYLRRVTKHEYRCSVLATLVGLFIMGFLYFIIRLLDLPISNIILGFK
ncbi:hypothetical protein ACLKA6_006458 [Drosophila palustris]